MSKFDITQWCDFVRGLVEPEAAEAMKKSLSSGSKESLRTVDSLTRFDALGRVDASLVIPDYALRGAKAIGSLHRPQVESEPASGLLRFLPFELSFDSFLQPALSGTRKTHATDRQLIFKAESYLVDLRLEQESDLPNTVIVGEILEQGADEDRPVSQIPVWVKSNDQIVGHAITGEFGEFQAEGLPVSDLTLCLIVADDICIELPIVEEAEA